MSHLAVSGGAGYVGSHTLRALLRAGHTAVVADDLRTGHEPSARGAALHRIDVGDAEAAEQPAKAAAAGGDKGKGAKKARAAK